MVEWLRLNLIGPVVVELLPLPEAIRFAVFAFLLMLMFYVLPWWWLVFSLGWLGKPLLHVAGASTMGVQRLACGQPYDRKLVNGLDQLSEACLVSFRWVFAFVNMIQSATKHRPGMQKRWLLIVPLAIIGIGLLRNQFDDTVPARFVNSIVEQVNGFERWAVQGLERDSVPGSPAQGDDTFPTLPTLQSPIPEADDQPGTVDPVHIVEPGEILRLIAQQYDVTTRCLMDANSARYPDQNWNSLQIGQELTIPVSDPNCVAQ